ncbi:MAG: 2OG-Fe(II) oxygenase [Thiohalocapsa sp.]
MVSDQSTDRPNLQDAVAELLARVERPGDYYATGTFDIHLPRLTVEAVGSIALPLLPAQAERLIATAEQAPYGRGSETLVDTDVRRTWQIDAARVRIEGRRWEDDLSQVVELVAAGLGVSGHVEAELYKLLVYDTGSFFVSHRDSEKAPGMFATLVLILPSQYSGGELVIRHKGHEVSLDLQRDEPSEVAFAAFYADCRHEVKPIESGCRLALVFNLLRPNGGPLPVAPDHDAEQSALAGLLRRWGVAQAADDMPRKLIYPLEHSYTEAELGFSALKGADAAVAGVVLGAARESDCDLCLALVSITDSGWADYAGGGYWGDDDADYEIGEIEETSQEVRHWRLPGGTASSMGALPFAETEISPQDAFSDLEDTEPDFEEATGNEGVSFERFYQRAALVLWPRTNRAAVLVEGGVAVSVPFLGNLVTQWQQAGGHDRGDAAWQRARELAIGVRDAWPEDAWSRQQASKAGLGAGLLDAFCGLGDYEGAAAFIAVDCATGAYGAEDNPAIAATLSQLPQEQAADLLTSLVANNGARRPSACAALLALCSERLDDVCNALRAPALALLSTLPTESVRSVVDSGTAGQPTPDLVVYTLVALERVDAQLAERAIVHFLAWPDGYQMDRVMLPAVMAIGAVVPSGGRATGPASVTRLRQAVLEHLERRIAEPLAPPADWRRPAEVSCSCVDCRQLNAFLGSPTEPEWRFKAAEAKRRHLEHSVSKNCCDLDLSTETRGRPYTLVCTKNQASYQRRVRQREQDLFNRERLLMQ